MPESQNKFNPEKYNEHLEKANELFTAVGMDAVISSEVMIEPVIEGPHTTKSLDELELDFVSLGVSSEVYTPPRRAERNLVAAWNPSVFLTRPK